MSHTFNVHLHVHDNYLECRVSGKDSTANTRAYWQQLHEAAKKHNIDNILIVEKLEGQPPIGEVYRLVEEHVNKFWGKRIAFVDRIPDHSADNRLAATLFLNRGVVVEIFDQEADALDWLLKQE